MTFGGPAAVGVSDRQVYGSCRVVFPHRTRNLFAVQQVMLDTGEDAAPVTTVNRFVNYTANLYINSVTTENPVVDSTEQIQQPALFPH